LDQAREGKVAETKLEILESRQDKLVSIAQSVEDEADKRSKEELIDMIEACSTTILQLLAEDPSPELVANKHLLHIFASNWI
jgi:hypothetical protein